MVERPVIGMTELHRSDDRHAPWRTVRGYFIWQNTSSVATAPEETCASPSAWQAALPSLKLGL
jgi:hypothetical protein